MATPASISMDGIVVARPWRLALLPSLTDFFFLCAIAWMFMAADGGWQALLRDGDTGVHLRVGDLILDTGAVPTHDPFSFSKPGGVWFAHEWLTGAIYALLVRAAGLKALVLLTGVILALYNTVLLRQIVKRGGNSLLAMALVLAGTNAASIHFHTRPHVFTLLFLTLAMALIAEDRQRATRWVWLLVPMTALWANMHGGFVILFPVLGIVVLGSIAEMFLDRPVAGEKRKMALRYFWVGVGCGAASLVNPQGIKLHLHIIELLRTSWFKTHISEYQSPSFNGEATLFFMALLFLGLAAVYPLLSRKQVTEAIWILFFAYWSLTSARNIPLFVVVVVPLVALEVTRLWQLVASGRSRKSTIGVLDDIAAQTSAKFRPIGVWAALFVVGIFLFTPANRWPGDFSKEMFPLALMHRHAGELAAARVFAPDQWADYLIYLNYPRQRVFIDGRSDYYGEEIGKAYLAIIDGRPKWRELFQQYSFDMVLCPPDLALVSLLRASPEWHILDQDKDAVLFVKD
ncbi:MAG TPA: hypothetical protein VEU96_32755 [Bryobacteraceae bacterium]|nr:hypothetical protein [Bryobacteraceae bacterium]